MNHLWSRLIEPGFFASDPVRVALTVGAIVAVVSAVVGVFTVIRGQSFAGHAIGDMGTTGGSAAFLVGTTPIWGFVSVGLAAAGIMELIGIEDRRGRDLATGIVLGAGTGLAALFLYWDATLRKTTGATLTILFGSIFTVSGSIIPIIVGFSLLALGATMMLYRPLLLSSLSPDMAAARGVQVRLVGLAYLLALAIAVSLAAVTIGAILSTALLIGPAAGALRVTRTPGSAMVTAGLIGVFATWLGILLAYDSFYWPPVDHGWPVSFFVVTLVFLSYLLARLVGGRQARRRSAPTTTGAGSGGAAPNRTGVI
jgi:zinc/manganese transport system permease protein